ncbi:MAG TPA: 7TM domain-containing protein [Candidatus Woesebacteria bacterium]|nr:7TM domain-containing protein [Candidatus Woesebacteria bacterium]
MNKFFLFWFGILSLLGFLTIRHESLMVYAQTTQPTNPITINEVIMEPLDATLSASTISGSLSSPSAEVEEKIQEKKDKDLTDTSGKQKSELAIFLDQNPPQPLSWNNFLQHAIRSAVSSGVPANVIVLTLLFPVAAALIAASRHIVGLKGFGIYIPTVLSVAFVSTGIIPGIIIFAAITIMALVFNKLIKKIRIPYLPRTALLLWTISVGIFGLLMLAPILNVTNLMTVNIFPILILMLLSENFLDAQSKSKESQAVALTIETIILASISSWLLNWDFLQKVALKEPELLLLITALASLIIGKFSGLRVSERLRFRDIIEEEE